MTAPPKVTFFFDIACPFSYMANQRIDALNKDLTAKYNTPCETTCLPIAFGSLYKETSTSHPVYSVRKKNYFRRDLEREGDRSGVRINENPRYNTMKALQLLSGVPDMKKRMALANDLFKANWTIGRDVSDDAVLLEIAKANHIDNAKVLISCDKMKATVEANATMARDAGAFGVPTFLVEFNGKKRIFYGQDRMFLMALYCGLSRDCPSGHPVALVHPFIPAKAPAKIKFFHDFASPWSFIAAKQIAAYAIKHNVEVVRVPVYFEGMLGKIGNSMIPASDMVAARSKYALQDLQDWSDYHGGFKLVYPKGYPMQTALPMRVAIAEPKIMDPLYAAAWLKGRNIGLETVVRDVLTKNGFDADKVIQKANTPQVKKILDDNTDLAIELGGCGVPTFQINDDTELCWGQDRLNVASDMISNLRK